MAPEQIADYVAVEDVTDRCVEAAMKLMPKGWYPEDILRKLCRAVVCVSAPIIEEASARWVIATLEEAGMMVDPATLARLVGTQSDGSGGGE